MADNKVSVTVAPHDEASDAEKSKPANFCTACGGDAEKVQENPKSVAKRSRTLQTYLIIQYVLNALLAIIIIAIMCFTLAKYYSTQNVKGAWPANAILSPTFLMLIASVINVLVDAVDLVINCFSPRIVSSVGNIIANIRTLMRYAMAILPAVAASVSRFAYDNAGQNDLWGWSCSNAASMMVSTNQSDTVCTTNLLAWVLQILQVAFQILSIAVPMFSKWRVSKEAAAAATESNQNGGGDPMTKTDTTDDKLTQMLDDEKKFENATPSMPMGGM